MALCLHLEKTGLSYQEAERDRARETYTPKAGALCVCVCVCDVCIHICMWGYVCACMYVYVCVHVCACVSLCVVSILFKKYDLIIKAYYLTILNEAKAVIWRNIGDNFQKNSKHEVTSLRCSWTAHNKYKEIILHIEDWWRQKAKKQSWKMTSRSMKYHQKIRDQPLHL